ncbi:MAPEG family protein [Alginatibacterium sediminis]|uniref:MAPEG family protein n=1 Tax=Alginatibacterium sediminis TaxID=2164068 RepID=A0A420E651_9ALTE|nr:MAPEG family protein [Alginatibacterium sediminis]RKF13208.1 MAPEG family protein [Alginatibacterium sediminis]
MLPISALFASLCALLLLGLSAAVVKERRALQLYKTKTSPDDLKHQQRVHANACEYMPISLILLAIAELNGAPELLVWGFGSLALISRLLHAWGYSRSRGLSFGRSWGMYTTFATIIGLAFTNIVLALASFA